jgi:ribonuclease-3
MSTPEAERDPSPSKPTPPEPAPADSSAIPEVVLAAVASATDAERARQLVREAVTHRTFCNEHPGERDNQRLELLGDAVLELIVTEALYAALPGADEGLLSRARSATVNEGALADAARAIGLGGALRLGRGELASGGEGRARTLADALESVTGAVYLAAGLEAARSFVLGVLGARLDEAVQQAAAAPRGPIDARAKDAKSVLQELVQRRGGRGPSYELEGTSGPDHDRRWRVRVQVREVVLGVAEARSRREAEMGAAAQAIEALSADPALLEAVQRGGA